MHRQLTSVLVILTGIVLAGTVAWAIGVFAAISFTPEALAYLKDRQSLSYLLFGFTFSALPALILALVAGIILALTTRATPMKIIALASIPWLLYATLSFFWVPYPVEVTQIQKLRPLLSWAVWPPIIAVPLGLWLSTFLTKKKSAIGRSQLSAA